MVVRLDAYSVVYGLFLAILLCLNRTHCYRVWPVYVIVLIVLLVLQYLSCLGVPAALCWGTYCLCVGMYVCVSCPGVRTVYVWVCMCVYPALGYVLFTHVSVGMCVCVCVCVCVHACMCCVIKLFYYMYFVGFSM